MIKTTENSWPQSAWWLYEKIKVNKDADFFPEPVCDFAEIYYLAYLLFLEQQNNSHKKQFEPTIKETILYSFDQTQKIVARTIKKNPLARKRSLFQAISRDTMLTYPFGEDTYLVTTGEFAGTLAEPLLPYSNTSLAKMIRPIHAHDNTLSNAKKMTRKQSPLMISLFPDVKTQIERHGYMHALLRALEKTKIPHDPEIILENSKYPSYFQQTSGRS